jgi:hypothetical protein
VVPNDAPNRPTGLLVRLARSIFTVDAAGRITIAFTTQPNIRGTLELRPRGTARAAQRRFARLSFRSNARGAVRVRARLSRSTRRQLRRARGGRLRARLIVRSGARTTALPVTLRRRR